MTTQATRRRYQCGLRALAACVATFLLMVAPSIATADWTAPTAQAAHATAGPTGLIAEVKPADGVATGEVVIRAADGTVQHTISEADIGLHLNTARPQFDSKGNIYLSAYVDQPSAGNWFVVSLDPAGVKRWATRVHFGYDASDLSGQDNNKDLVEGWDGNLYVLDYFFFAGQSALLALDPADGHIVHDISAPSTDSNPQPTSR